MDNFDSASLISDVEECSGCRPQNALSHDEASVVMLDNGMVPLEPYPGGRNPWLCRHEVCGREVTPTRDSIKRGRRSCSYCSGQVVDHPERAMLDVGLVPLEPYVNKITPWLCVCWQCGNNVRPRRSNIDQGRHGCKYCAPRGFDPDIRIAYLYMAYLPDHDLTGFGITSDVVKRLMDYKREKTLWSFQAVFEGTGQEVLMFESELKVLVRELGEVDPARPAGFKTESLTGDWVDVLRDRAERAGLAEMG